MGSAGSAVGSGRGGTLGSSATAAVGAGAATAFVGSGAATAGGGCRRSDAIQRKAAAAIAAAAEATIQIGTVREDGRGMGVVATSDRRTSTEARGGNGGAEPGGATSVRSSSPSFFEGVGVFSAANCRSISSWALGVAGCTTPPLGRIRASSARICS